ncbi:unnamed protein product [Linum tenue]|uniref:Polygalacturonase n=1 Tax=Linum tenue TaxID=586396 RepID=A0AAV0H659_9ROSI|nr:unnamed protein product [Linum tenue]
MAEPKTDSTRAFSEAWKRACSDPRPSVVYVPYGKFHLRDIAFEGPCKSNAIVVRIDGTLVAPSDYSVIGNAGNWIRFHKVDGVRISGGILDGQGTRLWSCKLAGKDCPNVKLQRVTVTAPGSSPNTDGIHVERSSLVWILNSTISTGDDCISMGPGARNVWIERVACGPGHGISIGSLGWKFQEPGVENITVKRVHLSDTTNGLRIKTWARPSLGFVSNVLFHHVVMDGVKNPILIDQHYCPGHGQNCPSKASGVRVSGIRYKSIRGTSSTQVAVRFDCSKSNPCTGITMHDVALTYLGKEAAVTCVNARGTSSGFVTPLVRWS